MPKLLQSFIPFDKHRTMCSLFGSGRPAFLRGHFSGYLVANNGVLGVLAIASFLALTSAQSQEPQRAWLQLYNGPANNSDKVRAMAVDHAGNVLVTGYSRRQDGTFEHVTLKYSPTGQPLWTNRFSPPPNIYGAPSAIAVDSDNNVFVTGESVSNDSVTLKYSPEGAALWTNYGSATGMAIDRDGNAIIAGTSSSPGSFSDYVIVKYSPIGAALWTNRYDGPAHYTEILSAVAVDGEENVFVTGFSAGDSSYFPENAQFATIKYSSAGIPLWTNRFVVEGNNSHIPRVMVADRNGDIIITGTARSTASGNDYVTIKYSGAGVPLWTNRYDGLGSGHDYPMALAIATNGAVFVTGFSYDPAGFSRFATVAYSGAGTPLWTNRYDGPASGSATATATALRDDAVLVAGVFTDAAGVFEYVTIGYSFEGIPAWTNRFKETSKSLAIPKFAKAEEAPSANLVITSDGYLLAGYWGRSSQSDFMVAKYVNPVALKTTLGSTGWEVRWPSTHLGWRLEMSTQDVSNSDWTTVPGSTFTNRLLVPAAAPNTFLRLAYP
jgi:hypothetical protein